MQAMHSHRLVDGMHNLAPSQSMTEQLHSHEAVEPVLIAQGTLQKAIKVVEKTSGCPSVLPLAAL